jgi:hypothetical protein
MPYSDPEIETSLRPWWDGANCNKERQRPPQG